MGIFLKLALLPLNFVFNKENDMLGIYIYILAPKLYRKQPDSPLEVIDIVFLVNFKNQSLDMKRQDILVDVDAIFLLGE